MKRNISISIPHTGNDEWEALKEPIYSGWLTTGKHVNQFEDSFAKIHEVNFATAVSNATTALHLSLLTLGIQEGDEVIVPAFTWVSTANAVMYLNAKPVFCDIDLETFNLDPVQLRKKITKKTKAIIVVHLFGLCSPMDEIKEIIGDVPIIEDAACAAGSLYKGTPAGGLGAIGCFSFHPRKLITTGEGGMITTNDEEIAFKLRTLRNHGVPYFPNTNSRRPYDLPNIDTLGYNYRMTDLQGAVGNIQIQKLYKLIEQRDYWAKIYQAELSKIPWIKVPVFENDFKHSWQSFVLLVNEKKSPMSRNMLMEVLLEKGISTRPGTYAVHMLKYYSHMFNILPEDYPNSMIAYQSTVALPLHNRMVAEDFEFVIRTLKSL